MKRFWYGDAWNHWALDIELVHGRFPPPPRGVWLHISMMPWPRIRLDWRHRWRP